MFGQSLLSAFGIACTTDTDQLFATNQSVTSIATYQLNASPVTSIPGNNYPGTASNITFAAGKFGNAAVFNGSNSKIIANGKPLNNNTSITISFWARNINSSDWKTLLGEGGDSGNTPGYKIYTSPPSVANSNYLWIARADNSGYVFDTYDGSAANKGGIDMSVAGSAWVHCVFTVSPTQLIIYKNGVSVKSLSISNTSSVVGYYDFQFMYDTKYNRYLQGELDQVRLFDTTLSQAAVTALYNETTTTATSASIDYVDANPNSIAYYKMSDATDQLGNYNGTATNVNFNTEGKFGFAGAFNGSSSEIATGINNSVIPVNSDFTISTWINTSVTASGFIVAEGNWNAWSTAGFGIQLVSSNRIELSIANNGSSGGTQVVSSSIPLNTWVHIVATIDIGNFLKLYIDGSEVASTALSSNSRNSVSGFYFGSNSSKYYFNGSIDQIRIYDSAISAANVTTLYNEIECEAAAINALANFNTVLYTGNASTNQISTVGFAPDFTWIKARNTATANELHDSVRGEPSRLWANENYAASTAYNGFVKLTSNGFDLNNVGSGGNVNRAYNYVAWNWKAALANLSTSFNGSSSYISIAGSSFDYAAMTLSCWFNLDSTSQNYQTIFNNYSQTGSENRGWYIRYETGGNFRLRGYSDSNVEVSNILQSTTINAGTWYHLAVTITSSQVKIYQDSNLINTTSLSAAIGYSGTGGFPTIGSYRYSATNKANYFDGEIAQLRVFDDTLTSSEVSDLYAEPAASNNTLNYPAGAGCTAAYPLQTDAVDLSGNYSGASSNVTFGQPGYLTSNTDGTITSTVAANVDAGFSIVQWTGTRPTAGTLGHGLGLTPEMIIIKNTSITSDWTVYAESEGPTKHGILDTNGAWVSNNGAFNNTSPTSNVFTVGGDAYTNGAGNSIIAYCFASIPGYSKVGSYIGTGGAFTVYTGFAPSFVMIKRSDSGANWVIVDNKRGGTSRARLYPNLSNAEDNNQGEMLTSNGFSPRTTPTADTNINGGTFIYLAIA